MPIFSYKAIHMDGRRAQGRMEAHNEIDLEQRLERIGQTLITLRPVGKSLFRPGRIRLQELVLFCFQLEQMSSAGIPLLDGLHDLCNSTHHPAFQKIIAAIASEVENGKLFSTALAAHPQVFSPVFISLIQAGEHTGKLVEVLAHLAGTLKWQDELRSQTHKLLAYPLFVLVIVLAASAFLMVYLVPQMVSFLQGLGQVLPWQTRLLILISDAVRNYWWLMLAAPALILGSVTALIHQQPEMRRHLDHVKLHLPVTGNILRKIVLARFARYFALMYQAGIPVLQIMAICRNIVANRVLADALKHIHEEVSGGTSMADSFRNAGLFPPLVVRMISAGESTGTLDKSLLNISHFYDRDVRETIEKMLKLLEPALTVVLGCLLTFIMMSVLGPVYDSFSQLKL